MGGMNDGAPGRASGRRRRGLFGPAVTALAAAAFVAPAAAIAPSLSSQFGGLAAPNAPPDGLAVTGSFEALYDSNVLHGYGGFAASGHLDDFRYSPLLSATYARETGRIGLTVNGAVGHDFYQYNDYLGGGRYSGGGTVTYHTGSTCQASVNGEFSSRQNGTYSNNPEFDPVDALPSDVGIVVNNIQSTAVYGASAGCGSPTGRLTFGGDYSHASLTNAAPSRRYADSDNDTYSGNIGLGILRPGQLSLTGSYSTVNYPNRAGALVGLNIPPQLLAAGLETYRIGLALSRPIGTKLSGSFGASFLHVDPGAGQTPYSSPAYNIGLNYRATPRLSFTLTGVRDALPSTTGVSSYRISDVLQFQAQYLIGRSITVNGNAAYSHDGYRNSFAIPGEPARVSLTTKTFGAGLTYSPRRLYDVRVDVTQTYRDSNPTVFNYNSTRAGVTLAVHLR